MTETITAEISCVTNAWHRELKNVRSCTYPSSTEDEEGAPRRATHGFLCTACWFKTQDALAHAAALILHLRSIQVGSQGLSDRVATSLTWRIPIPPSWLMADNIMAALGAPAIPTTADLEETKVLAAAAVERWRNPEQMVSRVSGAVSAVVLYRQVQTALAAFPTTDQDRKMPAPLRCPNCQQLTLQYRAPLEYLDDLQVTCGSCGHEQDWETFTEWTQTFTKAYEDEQRAEKRRLKKQGKKSA